MKKDDIIILQQACEANKTTNKLDLSDNYKVKELIFGQIKDLIPKLTAEKWKTKKQLCVSLAQILYLIEKMSIITSQLNWYCDYTLCKSEKEIDDSQFHKCITIKSNIDNFNYMNSSLFMYEGSIHILVRAVNYNVFKGTYSLGNDGAIHTKHSVVRLHDLSDLGEIRNKTSISDGKIHYGRNYFAGLCEDIRLIPECIDECKWRFICSKVQSFGVKQFIGDLEYDGTHFSITKMTLVEYGNRTEKNWIPIKVLDDDITMCCYMLSPLKIIYIDSKGLIVDSYEEPNSISRKEFWGGSGFCRIPNTDNYLCIVHEYGSQKYQNRSYRTYYNRIVQLDRNFKITSTSNLLRFNLSADIEYIMSCYIENDHFYICVGLEDKECQIHKFKLSDILKILWDVNDRYQLLFENISNLIC